MSVIGHLRLPEVPGDDDVCYYDRLTVDFAMRRAWVDDEEVRLGFVEFELLSHFLEHRGRLQTHETLLAAVWGEPTEATRGTVAAHVASLSRKLGLTDEIGEWSGVGFWLREAPDVERCHSDEEPLSAIMGI